MTGGLFFAFSRYGDTYALPHSDDVLCRIDRKKKYSYRRMRKAATEKLSTSSVKEFYETQMKEAVVQACGLIDRPTRWDRHFRRTAASATLSIVYGHPTLTSEQDRIVRVINDFSERLFHAGTPGAHLVEFFPWLRHFPSR